MRDCKEAAQLKRNEEFSGEGSNSAFIMEMFTWRFTRYGY